MDSLSQAYEDKKKSLDGPPGSYIANSGKKYKN
jgi:hypothetical protein